jgi:hypothetical protein
MTWYNSDYRQRQIVGVNAFGGTGVAATIDVEIEVPPEWDTFWESIRSDFKDVVVTNAKGKKISFARKSGANFSTRTLILQVDAVAINNDDALNILYIYFDYPDETTDSAESVTITSPKNGYITLSRPHSRIISSRTSQNATDTPIQSFVKGSNDEIHVFFAITSSLAKRITPYNDRDDEEALDFVQVFSYDDSGTNSAERYVENDTRVGAGYIRASYKGGTNGDSYAIAIRMETTLGQIIETRAILRVIDLLP